jgi:predicted Zn-dependent protease
MKRHIPLEPDARVQKYVECVANRVIAQLPEEFANVEWEVVVFDEDEINAFADPNGKIGVFNGILRVADTPDALAAVIGHEVAHATEGHVMDRARKNARQEVWAMLGGAATGATDVWRESIAIGLGLPYAREQETEADLIGLQYMANAGFDPRAAVYLWKNMAAANKADGRERPRWSTHLSDDVRIDHMIKNPTPALVKYNAAREAGKRPACTMARRRKFTCSASGLSSSGAARPHARRLGPVARPPTSISSCIGGTMV